MSVLTNATATDRGQPPSGHWAALRDLTSPTVKVPGGLAFSEYRGYEAWQAISVGRNEKVRTP